MQIESRDYWKLFTLSACSVRLAGSTKAAVFQELIENFVQAGSLTEDLRNAALQALSEREALASTGVGQNVAIPHVKVGGIREVLASLSLHPAGVEWNSLDGAPVNLFFTVLRPDRPTERYQPERHLDVMRWISQLSRDNDFRRFAGDASTRKELIDLLREKSGG
jgi:PTS system fructose-specific IIA component/PTS system nitrogen regulatory IIA component